MGTMVRTREEMLRPEYNYYIFFGIAPEEQDISKIEKVILWEKNKWIQGSPIQKRYKELYSDVEQVMLKDSEARKAELANAKRMKFGEAVRLITIMATSRGYLYKSEMEQIVRSERIQWFTLQELENVAQSLVVQGIQYIDDTESMIDFRTYEKVEQNLIVAKKKTLYDVIAGKSSDSVENLKKCVLNTMVNLNMASSEKSAVSAVLGFANVIFKTEESKQKYNEYLAMKEEVWDELKLRKQHGIKEITLAEYLSYAEKMKVTLNMEIDKVERQLAAGLKHFGIAFVG